MYLRLIMIGWITLASSAFVTLAVAEEGSAGPQIAGKPANVTYPFVAEATANDVFIRSGRGPGYYHCGKLNRGDRVTVVEEAGGWAKILPLPENFSWIHKNYVKLDPQNPGIGTVTTAGSETVRVWAGSDYIEPIRSFSIQARLHDGEVVELVDPSQPLTGDYYKIKVPSGGYLWVNSEYLRYVGPYEPKPEPAAETPKPEPVEEKPLTLEQRLGVDESTPPTPAKPVKPAAEEPAEPEKETPDRGQEQAEAVKPVEETTKPAKPAPPSKETLYLKQCYELSEKINAELKKPITEQDYSDYKKQLNAIVEDEQAGKAKTYATLLLSQIERFELAITVSQTVKEQDERLEQIKTQIEKARQAELQRIPDPQEIPLFTGTVRPSFVYTGQTGQRRYLLTDSSGRIVCYMVPSGPEIAGRLEQLVGSEIGIRGDVISDPDALVTVVSVSRIFKSEEKNKGGYEQQRSRE
jgi:hypothetical protein